MQSEYLDLQLSTIGGNEILKKLVMTSLVSIVTQLQPVFSVEKKKTAL